MGLDGSPLADANGDGRKFHHRFLMPVFRPPFMALNVTYVGLVPIEKSCEIFSPVLLAILKSWRMVCVLPKEIEFVFQPATSKGDLKNGNSLSD